MAIIKVSNKKDNLPDVVKVSTSNGDVKIQKVKK